MDYWFTKTIETRRENCCILPWNIEGEADIILTIEMISVDFRFNISQTGQKGDEITGWMVNFSASPR